MPRWTNYLPFTLILLLAAILRLVSLRDVPPGLAQDEVLDAAIASFIRQGQHALFFREGYGHEPLYHYLAAPLAPLLGANVLSVRLPSAILGLLLVALTLRWAKREFGSVAAATAGIGLAISWWPIVFSRIGIRPMLEPVVLVAAAWFWPRRPWLAGVFLGLTVYSYTPARVIFLLPLLFCLYLIAHAKLTPRPLAHSPRPPVAHSPTRPLAHSLTILLVSLALAVPLYLTLRADPSLQQRVDQLSGPVDALLHGDIQPILATTLATLGVFSFTGDPRWTYTLPDRPLFDWFTALFFYGGLLIALVRSWRQPKYAFVLIWLGVTLLPSAVTPDAPSTVRLVGAMPVVYLLPGLAAKWIYDLRFTIYDLRLDFPITHHASRITFYAIPLLLFALFAFNLNRTIRDGFGRWSAEVETRLRYQTVLLDMARYSQTEPDAAALVIADTFFEPIDQETWVLSLGCDVPARWVQGGGAVIFPAEGNGRLLVPEFAPLQEGLGHAAALSATPLFQSQTRPTFAVYALPSAPTILPLTPTVTFDKAVTLRGYEFLPHTPGAPFQMLTYWQVEAGLPWDLAIFVHLLGPDGAMVAQADGLDAAASTLQPGDHFLQLHTLPLPDPLLPGPYTLQLGLYVRSDGRRLTHSGDPADRIVLTPAPTFDAP